MKHRSTNLVLRMKYAAGGERRGNCQVGHGTSQLSGIENEIWCIGLVVTSIRETRIGKIL